MHWSSHCLFSLFRLASWRARFSKQHGSVKCWAQMAFKGRWTEGVSSKVSLPLWLCRLVLELCIGTWISAPISHSWELHLFFLPCFSGIQKRRGSPSVFRQVRWKGFPQEFASNFKPAQPQFICFPPPNSTAHNLFSIFILCSVYD